jgi:hypothetical protein
MREVLMVYLCGVILLLAVSTMIEGEEGIGLDHILIAGFGWPILTPILALRAWTSRWETLLLSPATAGAHFPASSLLLT